MKNDKLKLVQVLNIAAWILITLLISYIAIKGCTVYTSVNVRQTIKQLGKEISHDLGIETVKNNVPILHYVYLKKEGEDADNNSIMRRIIELFPINQYVIHAKTTQAKNSSINSSVIDTSKTNGGTPNLLNHSYFTPIFMAGLNPSNIEVNKRMEGDNSLILGDISLINGESYYEEESTNKGNEDAKEAMSTDTIRTYTLSQLKDFDFLIKNIYSVDKSTKAVESVFDVEKLLEKDMTMKMNKSKPQILIFHTHSQETFINSTTGKENETIVGIGEYLEEILTKQYGIKVIHDTYKNDIINGQLDRDKAYDVAGKRIEEILKANPTIEVVIDLHRDGVTDGSKRLCKVNGKETAQVMFFNGLSRNQNGPVGYLYNPYITDNLAFSLQMKLKADKVYPGLAKKIYLRGYRYNLQLMPKSLLIELGTQNNTLQEAKNAMEPLAEILYQVLTNETVE